MRVITRKPGFTLLISILVLTFSIFLDYSFAKEISEIKDKYTSIYYEDFPPGKISEPDPRKTALLIVDMQNAFVREDMGDALKIKEKGKWKKWEYFYDRLKDIVIPNTKKILTFFRNNNLEVNHAIIASLHEDGRDRSLVQKRPGYNDILLPINSEGAQIIDELRPLSDEIVLHKTTDSVLMGTNYERILKNMGVQYVVVAGIVTDQCVSSTVRSLADAGFYIYVIEDCCAAASSELHDTELKIINHIYCNVVSTDLIIELLKKGLKESK